MARESQADQLATLAENAELFHTPEGHSYATIDTNCHLETHRVRSGTFRHWLVGEFWRQHEKVPGSKATADAMGVIEARARFVGPQRSVHLRVAPHDGGIVLDLGTASWDAVVVDADGWRIVAQAPVRFRRAGGMLPLPWPEKGGSFTRFIDLVNLTEDDWPLVVAWLVGLLHPAGPYAVLNLVNEAGTGKTFTSRVLRSVVDPNQAPLRSQPRSTRDLMIAAHNGWVIGLDNLSSLPEWLADDLCRLASGTGFATRELYSDLDETIINAARPIIINGIADVATREDLLDRCLLVTPLPIPDRRRRSEADLWAEFNLVHPVVLGALLDGVAHAIAHRDAVVSDLPRMADFARWAANAAAALGLDSETVLKALRTNRRHADEAAIDASAVAQAVTTLMESRSHWTGTATELLAVLTPLAGEAITKEHRLWPADARRLSTALRRVTPNLRRLDIEVSFAKAQGQRRVVIEGK